MTTKVTAKEEVFCQKYIKYLNKTKAALMAGYSKRSAKEIGYQTFTKPHIQARISEIREELKEELGISDHSVLSELAALSYWNIKDFITDDNEIKDLSKMPKSSIKPVIGLKTKVSTTKIGEVVTKEVTTELKMADKKGALVDLGRHLGIFEKDNERAQNITIFINGKKAGAGS